MEEIYPPILQVMLYIFLKRASLVYASDEAKLNLMFIQNIQEKPYTETPAAPTVLFFSRSEQSQTHATSTMP